MRPADVPRAIAYLRRLHLLGFNESEKQTLLSDELGYDVNAADFSEVMGKALESMKTDPTIDGLKWDLSIGWERADVLQNDLLAVYQSALRNYNAHQQGLREHPDGSPVIAVRPSELIALSNQIVKIDQERVNSRANAIKLLGGGLPGTAPAVASTTTYTSPSALMSGFADDIEDIEAEDAEAEKEEVEDGDFEEAE